MELGGFRVSGSYRPTVVPEAPYTTSRFSRADSGNDKAANGEATPSAMNPEKSRL